MKEPLKEPSKRVYSVSMKGLGSLQDAFKGAFKCLGFGAQGLVRAWGVEELWV